MVLALDFLKIMEKPALTQDAMDQLNDAIFSSHLTNYDENTISSYLVSRIRSGIHSEALLNIMTHSHNVGGLLTLDRQLNEVIIWCYDRHINDNHLFYLLGKDPRVKTPLIKCVGNYLSELTIEEINLKIADISYYSGVDACTLYLYTIESEIDKNKFGIREYMIIDSIVPEIKYNLLCKTIESGHFLFSRFKQQISNKYFFKYINDRVDDNSYLSFAIRNSPLCISFMTDLSFQSCLFSKYELIPNTIEHIFKRAFEQSESLLLSQMGDVYSKKKILRALISIYQQTGKRDHLDSFIIKYRHNEEIKNLIPFI
jgi:hypothetical protein